MVRSETTALSSLTLSSRPTSGSVGRAETDERHGGNVSPRGHGAKQEGTPAHPPVQATLQLQSRVTAPIPLGFGVEADLSLENALPPPTASSASASREGRGAAPSPACGREHDRSSPTRPSAPGSCEKAPATHKSSDPAHGCHKGTTRESTGKGTAMALGSPPRPAAVRTPAWEGAMPNPSTPAAGCQLTFPRHRFQDAAHEGAPGAVRGAACRRAAGGGPGAARCLPARRPPPWRPWSWGPGSAS